MTRGDEMNSGLSCKTQVRREERTGEVTNKTYRETDGVTKMTGGIKPGERRKRQQDVQGLSLVRNWASPKTVLRQVGMR